ncbi:MAG: hypothetical protein ACI8RZ_006456 [Myxococcota bacterium]|jgi:hypothetical protein
MTRLLDAWSRFWFAPVDARSLGVMRITLAILLIASHLAWIGDLTLLSDAGPVSTQTILDGSSYLRWSYLDGLSGDALATAHLLGLIPLVGMLVGWQSRLMCIAALVVQVALHHRAPWLQHGGDRILRISVLALCFAPTGAALSVDAWLARRRCGIDASPLVPVTAHRLVQIQLMVVYLFTGIAKLSGATWIGGTALYYALSSRTFQRFPHLLEPVLSSWPGQLALTASTWVTLAWELVFAAMVLFPRTRRWALIIGLAVHVGIAATMMVGSFSFATTWCYLAFLPTAWVAKTQSRRWQQLPRPSAPAPGR